MNAKLLKIKGYPITNQVGDILPVASVDENDWAMLVCDIGSGACQTLPFSPSEYKLCSATTRDELIQEMQAQFVKIGALLSDLESKLNLLTKGD